MRYHLKRRSTDGMLKGLFFQFDVPAYYQTLESDLLKGATVVGGGLQQKGRNWLAEYECLRILEDHPKKARQRPKCARCEADGAYTFNLVVIEQVCVECFQGSHEGSFFPQNEYSDNHLISTKFAERLRQSGLTGIEFGKATFCKNNRKKLHEPIGVEVLNAIGTPCAVTDLTLAPGVPNACPFCDAAPLFCPECHYYRNPCPKCQKLTGIVAGKEDGPDDRRLRIEAASDMLWIVDGEKWDGSDFNTSGLITKRALNFLLSIHAAPFLYRPAFVDVTGVSDAKLKKIEAAAEPVGPMR